MSQYNQGQGSNVNQGNNRPETGRPGQQGGDKTNQRPLKPSHDQNKKGDKTDNGGRNY